MQPKVPDFRKCGGKTYTEKLMFLLSVIIITVKIDIKKLNLEAKLSY